jgi:hypothetical protein
LPFIVINRKPNSSVFGRTCHLNQVDSRDPRRCHFALFALQCRNPLGDSGKRGARKVMPGLAGNLLFATPFERNPLHPVK